jgi:hypothetical protein
MVDGAGGLRERERETEGEECRGYELKTEKQGKAESLQCRTASDGRGGGGEESLTEQTSTNKVF